MEKQIATRHDQKVIHYTDDQAAKMISTTGWVSRTGRFWGKDEHMARWEGCTHLTCKCGKVMEKTYSICQDCRNKAIVERYNAMPYQEWDRVTPLYSNSHDKYFFDIDEISDFCEDEELTTQDLDLIICVPNHYRHVSPDYWSDEIAGDSDGDLPNEMQRALDHLNSVIDKMKPASYSPGKYRTSVAF